MIKRAGDNSTMNNSEYNRIIEKLKKSLEISLEKLYEELNLIENSHKLQKELREIENLEMLTYLESSEIIKYMSTVDPSFQIDPIELESSVYFYSTGKENVRFQTSPRYAEATTKLQIIKDKFDEYANLIDTTDKKVELTLRNNISVLENLYDSIGPNNKIIGEIEELETYQSIFDESWSDEDKIALYSILVKAHIENLINNTTQHLEELEKNKTGIIDKQADAVESEIAVRLAESKFNATVDESTTSLNESTVVENTHKVEISDETKNKIRELKNMIRQQMGELLRKLESSSVKKTYSNLKNNCESNNMSLQEIKTSLIPSDFKLFLTYCIYTEIAEVEELISERYIESEMSMIKALISETLKNCTKYAQIFADEERKKEIPTTPPTKIPEKETPMKLIFYVSSTGESEFEKSLKNISKEKLEGLGTLISKLEQGNFKNAPMLAKGNSSKLKYISNYSTFITFKVLPNNHILIYHIADIDEINKKTTNAKLSTYDFKIEQTLSEIIIDGTRFKEGTVEYRKLISENKNRLNSIKNKVYGTKRGGSRA